MNLAVTSTVIILSFSGFFPMMAWQIILSLTTIGLKHINRGYVTVRQYMHVCTMHMYMYMYMYMGLQ